MNYEEFKRRLGKAGVSAKDFAVVIGLNPNSVTNYAKVGVVPKHLAIMVTLMAELAENGLDFRPPLMQLGPKRGRPRGPSTGEPFGGFSQSGLF